MLREKQVQFSLFVTTKNIQILVLTSVLHECSVFKYFLRYVKGTVFLFLDNC